MIGPIEEIVGFEEIILLAIFSIESLVTLSILSIISFTSINFPKVDIVTNSGFMIGISSIKINKKIVEKLCKDLEKTIIKFV